MGEHSVWSLPGGAHGPTPAGSTLINSRSVLEGGGSFGGEGVVG
ncbi:hypothetical protein [Streptomyces sp. NPDC059957]